MRGPEDRVTSFSYRSLMPAGAGTPKYAKPGRWLDGVLFEGSELGSVPGLRAAGDKPQPYRVLLRSEPKPQSEEESSVRSSSYQSLIPACADTPRDENGAPYWNVLGAIRAVPHYASGFRPSPE